LRLVHEAVLEKVELFSVDRLHRLDNTCLLGDAAKNGITLVDIVKSALIDTVRKVVVAEKVLWILFRHGNDLVARRLQFPNFLGVQDTGHDHKPLRLELILWRHTPDPSHSET